MSASSKGKALRPWRVREQVARELAQVLDVWELAPSGARVGRIRSDTRATALLAGHTSFDVHAAREHAGHLYATAIGSAGPGRARLARHILDAIEGQPSECQACGGDAWTDDCDISQEMRDGLGCGVREDGKMWHVSACFSNECPDCQGTGHNLAGYLPEPEASPQLRRKRADQGMDAGGVRSTSDTWLDTELGQWPPGWGLFRVAPSQGAQVHTPDDLEQGTNGLTHRTRVTPRGEHRGDHDRWPECEQWDCAIDRRINGRGWAPRASLFREAIGSRQQSLGRYEPRWRRGELKHAQQRREREARRQREAIDARRIEVTIGGQQITGFIE